MTTTLRTVIIDSDADSRMSLRRTLAAHPSVVVVGEFSRPTEALKEVGVRRPDLVVVEVTDDEKSRSDGPPAQVIESLTRVVPDSAIFAMGPSVSADFVIQVIRAGALEFLRRPVERADLLAALEKVLRLRQAAEPQRRAGKVTSVFSTKGGLGVTTMATNLAVCLSDRTTGGTLLVDLDTTRQSDIATLLDLKPQYSVHDAFENLNRLDESFLRGLVMKHVSGLWVLPGPSRIERVHLTASQIQAGLGVMRSHYDHVVLDLRHDMDPGTLAALEASDSILFLTSLNVSALRSGAAGLSILKQAGFEMKKVKVVVMREGSGEEVTLKQAEETLGMPIYWKTPSDYKTVVSSINNGQPFVTAAPRSKISKNIRELAEMITPGPGSGPVTEPSTNPFASLLRLVGHPKTAHGG